MVLQLTGLQWIVKIERAVAGIWQQFSDEKVELLMSEDRKETGKLVTGKWRPRGGLPKT